MTRIQTNHAEVARVVHNAVISLEAVVVVGLLWVATAPAMREVPRSRATHVLNVTDEGHLHLVRKESSGSTLVEQGPVTGQFPCSVKAWFTVGATIVASVDIYPRDGGAIKGRVKATIHGSGVYESFAGSLVVTSGTGRYANAHGRAGFYGVFDRQTYGATVQLAGRLTY
jgi:hypothetical protein